MNEHIPTGTAVDGTDQREEHRHAKEYIYAYSESVEPNPIIGWTCACGVAEDYDDDQIAGLLP